MNQSEFVQDFSKIADQLVENQYWVSDQLFSQDKIIRLYNFVLELDKDSQFRPSQIGRLSEKSENNSIRSDKILWIDDWNQISELSIYYNFLEELKLSLNRELYISLKRLESHFAKYEIGSFYLKHVDQHKNLPNRLVTCLLYLSPWQSTNGGEIKLYLKNGQEKIIEPLQGRFVCFLTENLPHEVLPSHFLRFSITTWMRNDNLPF